MYFSKQIVNVFVTFQIYTWILQLTTFVYIDFAIIVWSCITLSRWNTSSLGSGKSLIVLFPWNKKQITYIKISELQGINTTWGEAKRKALVRIDNRVIISELQAINTTWGEAKRKALVRIDNKSYYLRAAGHKYNMRRGKEESPRQNWQQRYYLRAAGHKYNMGRGKEESPRQDEVERNCGCPMSPMGWSGISQIILKCIPWSWKKK